MMTRRQQLLALAMATVGALAWWQQQGDEAAPDAGPEGERRPDYTVDNFTATMMNLNGTPERRLTGLELRHYPDDESSELEQPVLTLFNEDGVPPWVIRSETGWVSAEGDEVRLHGQVFADRETGETTRPLHLKTRDLYIRPREEYAETDQPFRGDSEEDWVTSTDGAQIWFGDAVRVKLFGNVRGWLITP